MLYDTGDLISCDSSIHCSPSLTCLTRLSQDTLRDCDQESTCYNTVISPIYFVSFVLTAQFVLVNVVIAVLMKHLEESNKEAKEEAELEAELELEMKTLSPQPHSPLGSPFLWPGVEGPESPDSPKPGAPLAVAHAGAASRFSLEHPTVSTHPPPLRGVGDGDGWAEGQQLGGWVVCRVGRTADPRVWILLLLLPGCGGASSPQPVPTDGCPHSLPRATPASHQCWLIHPLCLWPGLASPSWLLGSRLSFLFPSNSFHALCSVCNFAL